MKIIRPFILLLLISIYYPTLGQDKCNSKVEYYLNEGTSSNFTISLRSSERLSNSLVELYDLHQGKVIQKKSIGNGLSVKQEVFTDVKPSLYIIYITQEGCKKNISIGGIQGIKVGDHL